MSEIDMVIKDRRLLVYPNCMYGILLNKIQKNVSQI